MHVFIDESGSFIPLGGKKSAVSAVGALVIPTGKVSDVLDDYSRVRGRFRKVGAEVKGSALDENEILQVISLLTRYDVLFEATVADFGMHSRSDVRGFQELQAVKVTEHLTDKHHPNLVRQVRALRDDLAALPEQLFTHSLLLMDLIDRVARHATLYYVQRVPEELGSFEWVVDAKDQQITPSEELWRNLIMPVMQTRSLHDPLAMLEGADYSHFDQFLTELDPNEELPAEAPQRQSGRGIDLNALVGRHLRFADSRDELGLELVDILTNALTRAMNGRLQPLGWSELGSLMIKQQPQCVKMVVFTPDTDQHSTTSWAEGRLNTVASALQARAKSMLTRENAQKALRETHPETRPPS